MADNKKNTDGRDDVKVDLNDPSEVEYLHSQHPKNTHEEIKEAIKKYGPYRKNIEENLKK